MLPLDVDNEEVNDERPSSKMNILSYIEFGSVKKLKILLKNNFFPPILKRESDFNAVWAAIDATKLVNAMSSIIEALQKYFCDRGKANRSLLVTNNTKDGSPVEKEELDLRQGFTPRHFPVLNHFCGLMVCSETF
jgi:hypothetical protein